MKLTDIPPHVTDLEPSPPYLWKTLYSKYGIDLDDAEIIPLYHLDYYDGPLSAMIDCGGKRLYTKAIYFEERIWWAAWELTDEELIAMEKRNELFEEHVGTHNRYVKQENGNWISSLGDIKPQENWDKFYKNPDVPTIDYKKIEEREIFGIHYNPFRSW